MTGAVFSMDAANLMKFKAALALFPKEAPKAISQLLKNQAEVFKLNAIDHLEDFYTFRDRNFTEKKAWKIELPKATDSINKQFASVSSLRIDDGTGGLFTGWEEELTGKKREMRKKYGSYHRIIGTNAREGSESNIANRKYRLRSGGDGYNSDRRPNSFNYPELKDKQFLAMILKSDATGRSKRAKKFKGKDYALGKNKVFILGMNGNSFYSKGLYTMENGKLKRVQKFEEDSNYALRIDWRKYGIEAVNNVIDDEKVMTGYLLPLFQKLF